MKPWLLPIFSSMTFGPSFAWRLHKTNNWWTIMRKKMNFTINYIATQWNRGCKVNWPWQGLHLFSNGNHLSHIHYTLFTLFKRIIIIRLSLNFPPGLDASKYRSTGHCVQEILKNEGILAFYKVSSYDYTLLFREELTLRFTIFLDLVNILFITNPLLP